LTLVVIVSILVGLGPVVQAAAGLQGNETNAVLLDTADHDPALELICQGKGQDTCDNVYGKGSAKYNVGSGEEYNSIGVVWTSVSGQQVCWTLPAGYCLERVCAKAGQELKTWSDSDVTGLTCVTPWVQEDGKTRDLSHVVLYTKPCCSGRITISKTWTPNAPFGGTASFDIKDGDTVVDTVTIAYPNTSAQSKELPCGEYTVVETPPDGWRVNGETSQTACIVGVTGDANLQSVCPSTVTFDNELCLGSITVTKVWEGGKAPKKGLTISLTGPVTTTLEANANNGWTVTFSDLPVGQYKVSEDNPPKPWEPEGGSTSQPVTLTCNDGTKKVTFTNVKNPPQLNISHVECVEPGLVEIHFVLVHADDETDYSKTSVSFNATTPCDPDGIDLIAPYEKLTGDTVHYTSYYECGDGTYTINSASVTFDGQTFNLHNPGTSYNITNCEACKGRITVKKTWVPASGSPIVGTAKFEIYDADGKLVGTVKIPYGDTGATSDQLPPGEYTVVETPPAGWMVVGSSSQKACVECSTGGAGVQCAPTPAPCDDVVDFKNELCLGKIKISKSWSGLAPGETASATFLIKDSLGNAYAEVTITGNGWKTIDVPCGNYTIEETSVSPGWVLITTPKSVTVTYGKTAGVSFTNRRCLGSIKINKAWEDKRSGEKPSATFVIKDGSGNVFKEVTISNGGSSATVRDVPCGGYTVEETSVSEGWVKDGDVESAMVENGKTAAVGFTNTKCRASITVVKHWPGGAGAPVTSLKITLKRGSSTVGTQNATADNGWTVVWNDLPSGSYSVTEESLKGWHETGGSLTKSVTLACADQTVDFYNEQDESTCKFDLKVKKVWKDVGGVGVSAGDKTVVVEVTNTDTNESWTSTAFGDTYTFKDLPCGSYHVEEISVPEGWELVSGPDDFSYPEGPSMECKPTPPPHNPLKEVEFVNQKKEIPPTCPTVSFPAGPDCGVKEVSLSITDLGSAGSVNIYWGDGGEDKDVGAGPHPHTYSEFGSYTIEVMPVVNGEEQDWKCGLSQEVTLQECGTCPLATLTQGTDVTCPQIKVRVTVSGLTSGKASIDWADGTTGELKESGWLDHIYADSGVVTGTIRVEYTVGGVSCDPQEFDVPSCVSPGPGPQPPVEQKSDISRPNHVQIIICGQNPGDPGDLHDQLYGAAGAGVVTEKEVRAANSGVIPGSNIKHDLWEDEQAVEIILLTLDERSPDVTKYRSPVLTGAYPNSYYPFSWFAKGRIIGELPREGIYLVRSGRAIGAFGIADPGGDKDGTGKTVPRMLDFSIVRYHTGIVSAGLDRPASESPKDPGLLALANAYAWAVQRELVRLGYSIVDNDLAGRYMVPNGLESLWEGPDGRIPNPYGVLSLIKGQPLLVGTEFGGLPAFMRKNPDGSFTDLRLNADRFREGIPHPHSKWSGFVPLEVAGPPPPDYGQYVVDKYFVFTGQ